MTLKEQIEYLFNKWKKYEIDEIFIDEASNIPEDAWDKLK